MAAELETDETLGTDIESDDSSLGFDLEPRELFGRTYHTYHEHREYVFPNDQEQGAVLDIQHRLFLTTLNEKLYRASIGEGPMSVLDVGTGTGVWAIEFADIHKQAMVTAIDLSHTMHNVGPPNYRPLVDDFEDPWDRPEEYHFIHARMVAHAFLDCSKFVNSVYESLRPGGYIEFQDAGLLEAEDGSMRDTALGYWQKMMSAAYRKRGRDFNRMEQLPGALKDRGFINVQVERDTWPLNGWPSQRRYRQIGHLHADMMRLGVDGWSRQLLMGDCRWSEQNLQILLWCVRNDVANQKIRASRKVWIVHAQKPEN